MITYEAPQPVSPSISEGYGATEQWRHDAPLVQHAQQVNAELAQRTLESDQRAAAANADRYQQGFDRNAALQAQTYGDIAQRQLHGETANADRFSREAMQTAQIGAAQAEQQQRFQQQLQMQQTELTHKEGVDLQRMKMAVGSIMDNDSFSPQEKQDLVTQLHTKIDPMDRRLAQSRMNAQDAHTKQVQQQLAEADVISASRAKFMAGQLQATTRDVTDEQGNVLGSMMMIPGEKPHWIDKKPGGAEVQAEKNAAALERAQLRHQDRMDAHGLTRGKFFAELPAKIERQLDDYVIKHDRKDITGDAYQKMKTDMIKEAEAAYDRGHPPPAAPGSTPAFAGVADASQKPFDKNKPETQTVEQRAALANYRAPIDELRAAMSAGLRPGGHLPQGELETGVQAGNEILDLLQKYGSAGNMRANNPTEYAKFDAALRTLNSTVLAARAKSAATPAEAKGVGVPAREPGFTSLKFQ